MAKRRPEGERLSIEYWPLSECLGKRWKGNAKKHDIPQLARSIQRYGFKDAVGWDAALEAFAEGNGRVEAVQFLKDQGAEAPRGILTDGKGGWFIPVSLGVDVGTEDEAIAYAIDHNNLVLGGGSFLPQDSFRLWGEGLYELFKTEENLPVTFEPEAVKALILARSADPLAGGETVAIVRTGGEPEGNGNTEPEPSHVRMVQLFLNRENLPEFQGYCERLATEYGTANVTDTVMECLRRAAAELA